MKTQCISSEEEVDGFLVMRRRSDEAMLDALGTFESE